MGYQFPKLPTIQTTNKALEAALNVLVRTVKRALVEAAGLPHYTVAVNPAYHGMGLALSAGGVVKPYDNGNDWFIGVSTRSGSVAVGGVTDVKSVGYAECLFDVGEVPVVGSPVFCKPATPGTFSAVFSGAPSVGVVTQIPVGYGVTTQMVKCLLCGCGAAQT